jgi:hypothetical protein
MLVIARAGPYRASREHARVNGTGACWAGHFGMPRTRARGAALSSAILYLAIVGIWALVLVPRWLRPSRSSGTLESNLAEPVYATPQEDTAEAAEDEDREEDVPGDRGDQSPARPSAAERRARVLQARRRMLVTLIVLTAGAAAIAAVHLAAKWVVIPPALMLAGFVLLLRAAARIDTEHARAAASRHSRASGSPARAGAGDVGRDQRQATGPADGGQAEIPDAKIIDISARVGDQLYDQYADAEVRAVGD